MKPGSVLAHALHLPVAVLLAHLSREAGGRAQVSQAGRVGRPAEAPLRGGRRNAALPVRGRPSRAARATEPGPVGGRQSWEPALAEAAAGLTLVLQRVSTQRREAPRRGQQSPHGGQMESLGSARGTGSSPDKGLRRLPGSLSARVLPRLPKCGPGRGAAPGTCAPRPLPRPSPLARPPPPARLPGFSLASAEEVAEESVRTLGSLCERPRDTRQPLPSSDAAMGPAGEGASWREPRGIRASEAAKVTGERAGGVVVLKRKIKKHRKREGAGGRGRGWLQGAETIASRLQPGTSRRARPRSVIYSCLFPFFSLYSRKKKS